MQSDGRHTYMSHDGSLIIRNAKTADEGSYTCNAYSGSHSVSASAEIKVNKHKPMGKSDMNTSFPLLVAVIKLSHYKERDYLKNSKTVEMAKIQLVS